jgi:cephalosporin hydroxylase
MMINKIVIENDKVLLNKYVFRFVHPKDIFDFEGDCFIFCKSKDLMDSYVKFWKCKPDFYAQNIFELGILRGGSVAFWYELFHPRKHVAIDLITKKTNRYFQEYVRLNNLEGRIKTYWETDQINSRRVKDICEIEFDSPIDLVVDDASHMYEETKASFETLFPLLRPGGIYIIEDWAWAYWPEFQSPEHPWSKKTKLSRLIYELIDAIGVRVPLIANITVTQEYVAIERGNTETEKIDLFKNKPSINMITKD